MNTKGSKDCGSTTRAPCEAYGHVYKVVLDFGAEPFKVYKVCDDCGDEYEANVYEL